MIGSGRGTRHRPVFLYFIASYSGPRRSLPPHAWDRGNVSSQTPGRFGFIPSFASSIPTMTLAPQFQVSLCPSTPDPLVLECTLRDREKLRETGMQGWVGQWWAVQGQGGPRSI